MIPRLLHLDEIDWSVIDAILKHSGLTEEVQKNIREKILEVYNDENKIDLLASDLELTALGYDSEGKVTVDNLLKLSGVAEVPLIRSPEQVKEAVKKGDQYPICKTELEGLLENLKKGAAVYSDFNDEDDSDQSNSYSDEETVESILETLRQEAFNFRQIALNDLNKKNKSYDSEYCKSYGFEYSGEDDSKKEKKFKPRTRTIINRIDYYIDTILEETQLTEQLWRQKHYERCAAKLYRLGQMRQLFHSTLLGEQAVRNLNQGLHAEKEREKKYGDRKERDVRDAELAKEVEEVYKKSREIDNKFTREKAYAIVAKHHLNLRGPNKGRPLSANTLKQRLKRYDQRNRGTEA